MDEKNDLNEIWQLASDIFKNSNIFEMAKYVHHRHSTVYEHSLYVTKMSIKYADFLEKLHIKVDRKSLIRGALLHDYFLYDWHDGSAPGNIHPKLHGFYHPGIALKNAVKDYNLSKREKDIIKKHMWPLTLNPPRCREGWIICVADKYASTLETLKLKKGIIAIDYAESL